MKKNLLIAGVAGFVILGGAVGASAVSDSVSPKASTEQSNGVKATDPSSIISMDEAIEIAIDKVGGVMRSVELDDEDGRPVYELEMDVEDYDEVEVEVDAVTGEVIKVEKDRDDEHGQEVKVTKKEAVAIALADTPGKVTEVEFDSDDKEYEIEIKSGNKEVELKISAETGDILEKEVDQDDDQ